MATKLPAFLFFTLLSFAANAQDNSYHLQLAGGVKNTVFETARKQVTAYNLGSGYSEAQITPTVKNTVSFFAALKGEKAIGKRLSFTNTAGLDMQQLNIITGFRKNAGSNASITSYSQDYVNELLPRLKVDVGLQYLLVPAAGGGLGAGVNAGQMIALSSEANSYSFIEANVNITGKRTRFFISGSLTPYDVQLKGFDRYVGNKGAEFITASYAFRIYELGLGMAIRL